MGFEELARGWGEWIERHPEYEELWFKYERNFDNHYLSIYADEERTILLDTLSVGGN